MRLLARIGPAKMSKATITRFCVIVHVQVVRIPGLDSDLNRPYLRHIRPAERAV